MHVGEEFAGASQAGLNFVGHQQHAILAADFRRFAEKSLGRKYDSGLALNRLDQKGASVRGDGFAQGASVAEGNDFEPRSERAKAVAILFVAGEAHDGDGAAMKIVGADNDLGFVLRECP